MMEDPIDTTRIRCVGMATCTGGDRPNPPIDAYPLLAYVAGEVRTEDGVASVEQIAVSIVQLHDFEEVAIWYHTSAEHVAQAVAYAVKAGFLSPERS